MSYSELEQRGTAGFPIAYYFIDKNDARYEMSAHWHSELEIIRVLEGKLRVRLNEKIYFAEKDDVVFVNSETVHSAIPEDCVYEVTVFHLDFFNLENLSCKFFAESILNHEYIIREFNPDKKAKINKAAEELFDALRSTASGHQMLAIGAFYKLFGIIVNEHLYVPTSGMSDILGNKSIFKLKNVLTFIHENYDKQISLEAIAASAGMSTKYFCRFFKELTGKTPIEYLMGYRIEKASKKLLNSDLTVTEVAFSSGFNDLSYFIKIFKREKGISPAKFRKV